jgi:IPT/TIG domain
VEVWSGADIVVTAMGNSPLGQFQRQATTEIAVYPVQATIHEPFTESAPDADSDGQYDSLNWSFPVQVAGAGSYSIVGDLVAVDGIPVSHATTSVRATATGDMHVTLIFPGEDVYRGSRMGPYMLSSVEVYFAADDGQHLVARDANLAVSGGAYWSWLNFEREESPKLTWVFPVVQEVTPSNSVTLRWRVQDGNGATTFDLYYDTTGEGFDGTVIATGLDAVDGGLMSYDWDISALPDGVYYVYARIRNGDYSNAVYGGSIARLIDTDGEGAPDSWEALHGLNPNDSSDAFEDSDGDGLANLDEYFNSTDPQMVDTDAGGESDYSELVNSRNPLTSGDDVVGISLLSVTPAVGDSRGGDTLFVIGSGFQNGATVDFGGTMAAGVTFINSTRLLVVTPTHTVATVDFTVTNPSGGGSAMKAVGFTFLCEFVEPPVASNSGPFCPGQPLHLNAPGPSEATYQWVGPNGFASSLQNPTIDPATAAAAGQYKVTMTVGSCQVDATTAAVSRAPATPSVSSNGPLCSGQDLNLSATTVEGATYSWTGPNGFVSTQKDPVLPAANPAASGIYSVTATVSSCPSAPASTEVVVHALPTAVVSGSAQICLGESTAIQAALTGTAPWALTWSDGVSQNGLVASPAVRTVQPTVNTTFEVTTVSDAYCAGTGFGSAEVSVGGQCGSDLHTASVIA